MISENTLNHLERDPVVFWGCTFREIKNAGLRSVLFSFPIGMGVGLMPIPYGLNFGVGIVCFFLSFYYFFKKLTSGLAKLRSDKPLYYDLHFGKAKTGVFIKSHTRWQRERN